jgi:hypothetical protein
MQTKACYFNLTFSNYDFLCKPRKISWITYWRIFFMKMLNPYKEYNYFIHFIVKLKHWKEIFYDRKRQFMSKCVVLFLSVTRCNFIGCYFIWITFNWILLFLWNQINVSVNWIWKPTVCWFLLRTSCECDHELLHVVLRVANKVK